MSEAKPSSKQHSVHYQIALGSHTQNADMAEEFNNYFASVYTKENTNNIPEASGIYQGTVNDSLQDVLVDRYLIQKRLQKLRTDKAPARSWQPFLLIPEYDWRRDSAADIHSDAEVTRWKRGSWWLENGKYESSVGAYKSGGRTLQ